MQAGTWKCGLLVPTHLTTSQWTTSKHSLVVQSGPYKDPISARQSIHYASSHDLNWIRSVVNPDILIFCELNINKNIKKFYCHQNNLFPPDHFHSEFCWHSQEASQADQSGAASPSVTPRASDAGFPTSVETLLAASTGGSDIFTIPGFSSPRDSAKAPAFNLLSNPPTNALLPAFPPT